MEAFGLLNLLKSALTPTPENPSSPKAETPNEPVENISSTSNPTPEPELKLNNACLDFINRHEERAGRQRKR